MTIHLAPAFPHRKPKVDSDREQRRPLSLEPFEQLHGLLRPRQGGNLAAQALGGSAVGRIGEDGGDRGNDTLDGGPDSPDVCRGDAGTDTATVGCEITSGIP